MAEKEDNDDLPSNQSAATNRAATSVSTGTAEATSARAGRSVTGRAGSLSDQQLAKFIKQHLRTSRKKQVNMVYDDTRVRTILDTVRVVLKRQDTLVRAKAPLRIVGDIHGQYTDLKRLFRANGRPPDTKYIFLGDYVDRGKHSLECIMLLFAYKALYPDSIILLRGNHECDSVNSVYGFYDELKRRNKLALYPEFNSVFNFLPLAATVNGKILCMHGGISQYVTTLSQIKRIRRPLSMNPPNNPDIAVDLLWADPDKDISGFAPSTRGVSFVFGLDALEDFCRLTRIELVVRGHQVATRGFERIGRNRRTRLVTVFSAPNYCNEFDNSAAVMIVSANLSIHFSVLEPSADAQYQAVRNAERQNTPQQDVYPTAQPPAPTSHLPHIIQEEAPF